MIVYPHGAKAFAVTPSFINKLAGDCPQCGPPSKPCYTWPKSPAPGEKVFKSDTCVGAKILYNNSKSVKSVVSSGVGDSRPWNARLPSGAYQKAPNTLGVVKPNEVVEEKKPSIFDQIWEIGKSWTTPQLAGGDVVKKSDFVKRPAATIRTVKVDKDDWTTGEDDEPVFKSSATGTPNAIKNPTTNTTTPERFINKPLSFPKFEYQDDDFFGLPSTIGGIPTIYVVGGGAAALLLILVLVI